MWKNLTASWRSYDLLSRDSRFTLLDAAAYLVILAFGSLQFFWYMRAVDVIYTSTYVDLAHSLLESGSYQSNFHPETLLPPGLPALLALAWLLFGRSLAVGLHLMAVCSTLALAASYALLRRVEGRAVAVLACVLLASSPDLFLLATGLVASDLPYFLASTFALVLAFKLDETEDTRFPACSVLLCSASVVAAILFRTSGVAIVIGLTCWITTSFWFNRGTGWRRLKVFSLPLMFGLGAQGLWSTWAIHRSSPEWPVPGYPQPYFSQLRVKNGNEPMLGMATLRDIPTRIGRNLDNYSVELVKVMTRKTRVNPFWCSPFVAGFVLLVLVGLLSSLIRDGGQLYDWYFALSAAMVVLWPWDVETRFLYPIAPLVCMYLWRGGKSVLGVLQGGSVTAAACVFLVGATLSLCSLRWMMRTHLSQSFLSLAFWAVTLIAGAGAVVFRYGLASMRIREVRDRLALLGRKHQEQILLAVGAAVFLACSVFVAQGAVMQTRFARWNTTFDFTSWILNPSIEAGKWIRQNEPSDVVVMARKNDLVYHYSDRRVVWFPPTDDSHLLMWGIQKYHVTRIVVTDTDDGYWRPSESACFERLRHAYPGVFRPLYRGRGYWLYEVDLEAAVPQPRVSMRPSRPTL